MTCMHAHSPVGILHEFMVCEIEIVDLLTHTAVLKGQRMQQDGIDVHEPASMALKIAGPQKRQVEKLLLELGQR